MMLPFPALQEKFQIGLELRLMLNLKSGFQPNLWTVHIQYWSANVKGSNCIKLLLVLIPFHDHQRGQMCTLPCFRSPHIHLDPHFGAVILQDVVLARRDQHPVGPLAAVRRRQNPFRICVRCNATLGQFHGPNMCCSS